MVAPNSFTGEDVAELHIHSSHAVISALLETLGCMEYCRLAEPGEFSRRAFHHGKLDLTAVEGLADLIAAETEAQRRLALHQLTGGVKRQLDDWRERLIVALAMTEAWIDFAEDELIEAETMGKVKGLIDTLMDEIDKQLEGGRFAEIVRHGFRIALCGPPNVGKSSILNQLARRKAAIVSPIAGTTRDVLEVMLDLGGIPAIIADTAGIRDSLGVDLVDEVEREGIRRALEMASMADLVLFVLDSSEDLPREWPRFLHNLDPLKTVLLLNKSDLPARINGDALRASLPPSFQQVPIWTSTCKDGDYNSLMMGLACIISQILPDHASSALPIVTQERHRQHLKSCRGSLEQFISCHETDVVLAAEHLRSAARSLGQVTGHIDHEVVLDALFSRFCIGK